MHYLLTAAQMRAADSYTSEQIGIPALVLMERAALAVADAAEESLQDCRKTVEGIRKESAGNRQTLTDLSQSGERTRRHRAAVICGSGNNGADGVAAGRILADRGWDVRIILTGDSPKPGIALEKQLQILHAYGLQEESFSESSLFAYHPQVIIDAIFGTGLSREVTGVPARAIYAMESLHRSENTRIVSADIPSGISSDTGAVLGCAVHADETITFGFAKLGEYRYPGCQYCGRLTIADIGITLRSIPALWKNTDPDGPGSCLAAERNSSAAADGTREAPAGDPERRESSSLHEIRGQAANSGEEEPAYTFAYDHETAADLLPPRDPSGNKGTFGKVLVIAGSRNMCGAALLCSEAALRSGAGMVKIFTEECNRVIVQTKLPQMLLSTYAPEALAGEQQREDVFRNLSADLGWADTILIGPGIGRTDASQWLVTFAMAWIARSEESKRVVIDADAVRILGETKEFSDLLTRAGAASDLVLTPHMAECAALLHVQVKQLKENAPALTKTYADAHNCSILCKDARSTAVSCRSSRIYLNVSGNDGLSTAGSGDVLAGMTAGLMAQGMPGFEALCAASWLHGRAAEMVSRTPGPESRNCRMLDTAAAMENTRSVTAADLLPALGAILSVPRETI